MGRAPYPHHRESAKVTGELQDVDDAIGITAVFSEYFSWSQ